VSSVMAVFDFHGESSDLAARYDAAIHQVVAVSPARPLVHLAVPREYGFMVVDVWPSVSIPCTTSAGRWRRCRCTAEGA
jgi:hypothetical protein